MGPDDPGRVVVGVSLTLAGYEALRYAVARARESRTALVAVRAYRCPSGGYSAEWHDAIRDDAAAAAKRAFDEALGGVPRDIEAQVRVGEGPVGWVLTQSATLPADLLVIGGSERRLSGGRVAKYCARHAACPVVIVPKPAISRSSSAVKMGRDLASEAQRYLDAPAEPKPAA